jgi:hypothetical protein
MTEVHQLKQSNSIIFRGIELMHKHNKQIGYFLGTNKNDAEPGASRQHHNLENMGSNQSNVIEVFD